jgi:ribosomal protein L40E
MAPMKNCPDCLSEVPDGAEVCCHCGERIEGKRCPACGARNWEEATVCRWCGHTYESRSVVSLSFDPFTVKAEPLPTLLQRGRLLAQSITLTREKIIVSTPGPFNLSKREEEIPWRKVAGFDYRSGIFWDQVKIETRGQSSARMTCMAKADGQRIRDVLQQLET